MQVRKAFVKRKVGKVKRFMVVLVVLVLVSAVVSTAQTTIVDIDFDGTGYTDGEQPPGPWFGTATTVQAGLGYDSTQGLFLSHSSGDTVYYELPTPLTSDMGAVSISILLYPEENNNYYGANGGVMVGWETGGSGAVRDIVFQKVGGGAGIYGPGSGWGTYMGPFSPYHWYQITFDIHANWEGMTLSAGLVGQEPVLMTTGWNSEDPITKVWLYENQQSGRDSTYDNFFIAAEGSCPSADLTGDCFVDMQDIAEIGEWWYQNCDQSNNFCEGVDFDSSGKVTTKDLLTVVLQWLEGDRI